MDSNPFLWISVIILFLLAEVGHPGLFCFLPCAIGAAVSALLSVWTESLLIQAITFLVGSVVAFIVIHLWLKKHRVNECVGEKTNADALVGLQTRLTQAIEEHGTGYVKVNGQVWMVRSVNGNRIEVNAPIEIVEVRGAHLIVKEIMHS